jgi:hypothetical protein
METPPANSITPGRSPKRLGAPPNGPIARVIHAGAYHFLDAFRARPTDSWRGRFAGGGALSVGGKETPEALAGGQDGVKTTQAF